jgi:hypothetical protein
MRTQAAHHQRSRRIDRDFAAHLRHQLTGRIGRNARHRAHALFTAA